jgi:hypothetical protein
MYWVPIKDGADRIGVLRAVATADELTPRRLAAVASLVAAMVTGRKQYGDDILLARRRQPMTLPAEMRWSMLPPLTYSGPGVSVAGVLEPAYEIAGDTFDYGVNGDDVHLAILDAMGHGLEASVMASLAVSSYRHSRRAGLDLDEMVGAMDAVITSQFPDDASSRPSWRCSTPSPGASATSPQGIPHRCSCATGGSSVISTSIRPHPSAWGSGARTS